MERTPFAGDSLMPTLGPQRLAGLGQPDKVPPASGVWPGFSTLTRRALRLSSFQRTAILFTPS